MKRLSKSGSDDEDDDNDAPAEGLGLWKLIEFIEVASCGVARSHR